MSLVSRAWMFTWNNPGDAEPSWDCSFIAYQKEVAPSTGTEHWQGYCVFDKPMRLSGVRKLCACHWEVRKGSHGEALKYVTKAESRVAGGAPVTRGVPPAGQGARKDLESLAVEVMAGKKRMSEVAAENPVMWIRYHKGLTSLRLSTGAKRVNAHPSILVLTGATGVGKTRWVFQNIGDFYKKDPNTKWWDRYDGEDVVVFDEFYGGIQLSQMLEILGWEECSVETKGGYVQLLATKFIFCSNTSRAYWYMDSKPEVKAAFDRRMAEYGMTIEANSKEEFSSLISSEGALAWLQKNEFGSLRKE